MIVVWLSFALVNAVAQTPTAVSGEVTQRDGAPLAGVMVLVRETGALEWTSSDGRYTLAALRPGTYTLVLSLGGYSVEEKAVVTEGQSSRVTTVVDWPLSFVEMLVVRAPSRQVESLTDAPAAVTTLDAVDVGRRSTGNQLPLLLADGAGRSDCPERSLRFRGQRARIQ